MNTIPSPGRAFRGCLAVALVALALSGPVAIAQTNVTIEQLVFEPAQIRVVFKHPIAGSTNFFLQGSSNLTNWTSFPGVTVSVLGLGHVELRMPRAMDARQFFRVLANISTNDADGDGLPDAVELLLGTDPHKVDTDGDGFSDGIEVLAGTNPLDPTSFPTQSGLPVAAFTNSVSLATGGAGGQLVTVVFDRPFHGNLRYRINPRSTAVAGQDYETLSGSVPVAGTVAQIFINPIDDLVVRQERLLLLELVEAVGYRMGIRSSHVVRIADDDAYWSGTLKDKYAERNFRLKRARQRRYPGRLCRRPGL